MKECEQGIGRSLDSSLYKFNFEDKNEINRNFILIFNILILV